MEVAERYSEALEARTHALAGVVQAGEDIELAQALWKRAGTYNKLAKSLANDLGMAGRLEMTSHPRRAVSEGWGSPQRDIELF